MNCQQDFIMDWIEQAVILRLEVTAFITGAGGVGKSRIIAEIKKKYEGICLITSLMAKAALAIGGRTLHSALKIPIGGEICGWLKDGELDGFSILIIDEVTLLDMHLINRIDEILRKAKNPNRPFGGMITLLFGDFLQLSPRNTSAQKEELKFIYDSYFWKDVVTLHLTKNMRTSEDPSNGDLVLRWREGVFSEQDRLFLSQKAVVNRLATKNDYQKVAERINNLIGSVDHCDTMFVAHPNFVVDWMNYAII